MALVSCFRHFERFVESNVDDFVVDNVFVVVVVDARVRGGEGGARKGLSKQKYDVKMGFKTKQHKIRAECRGYCSFKITECGVVKFV